MGEKRRLLKVKLWAVAWDDDGRKMFPKESPVCLFKSRARARDSVRRTAAVLRHSGRVIRVEVREVKS